MATEIEIDGVTLGNRLKKLYNTWKVWKTRFHFFLRSKKELFSGEFPIFIQSNFIDAQRDNLISRETKNWTSTPFFSKMGGKLFFFELASCQCINQAKTIPKPQSSFHFFVLSKFVPWELLFSVKKHFPLLNLVFKYIFIHFPKNRKKKLPISILQMFFPSFLAKLETTMTHFQRG